MKYILLLSTLILFSCTNSRIGEKNILNVGLSGEIPTLDPAQSNDTVSAKVIYQGNETLFEYEYLKRPYTLRPLLATSMPRIENSGKRYIISIKKGVLYHDDPSFGGKPRFLIAQDFINQFKRLAFRPTKTTGWWLVDGKIVGINSFRNEVGNDLNKLYKLKIKGLTAPDDHTLIIDLTEPNPQMLYALAMNFTSPVPLEVIKYYKNDLKNHMVGTGPFKFVSRVKGKELLLKKFEHYREDFFPDKGDRISNLTGFLKDAGKRIPFLDGIRFIQVGESSQRWRMFRNKELDFMTLPIDYYNTVVTVEGDLKKDLRKENLVLQIAPTLTYWWLAFNMNDPLLGSNRYLRLAIAHAIDTEKYIRLFTNNVAQKANSIYAPGTPGYTPSKQLSYEFNLKKAKQLLTRAGYPNGKGLPAINYDLRGVSSTNKFQAQFIKDSLAKIGIKLNVINNTFPEYLKKSRAGKLQFWQGGWTLDYPDAENLLQLLISKNMSPGPNASNFSNKEFDGLFNQLKLLPNGKRKTAIMDEMENIVQEEVPWIMLFYSRNYILNHSYLKNYRHSDLIYNNMKYLRLGGN